MGTPIRDHQKREQKAFSRLICRYEPVSTKDLVSLYARLQHVCLLVLVRRISAFTTPIGAYIHAHVYQSE